MSSRDTEERELYVGDFEGFVARRNEVAKRLRADGDSDEADRVKVLKKPSRVAWAINQVSAREKKLRDELLDAGAALREAQERLLGGEADRADLRSAGDREQAAVERALDAVGAAARDAGADLSSASVERTRQTLHAVALDEDVRREFEDHRLTTDHEPAGLGGLARSDASTPAKAQDRRASKKKRDALKAFEAKLAKLEKDEKKAERDVDATRRDDRRAQQALERATKALDEAAKEAAAAREGVESLRERVG